MLGVLYNLFVRRLTLFVVSLTYKIYMVKSFYANCYFQLMASIGFIFILCFT